MINTASHTARSSAISVNVGTPPARRLPHLDGLRAVAAVAVLLYHAQGVFGVTMGFERAYLFVDLFFLLSGFVLSLAWVGDNAASASAVTLFAARIRRLWPTMAAALGLSLAVHWRPADVDSMPLYLLLGLLFVPAVWLRGSLFPLDGPQWSLFWELFANLAHLMFLRRLGIRGLVTVNLIMGFAFALCIAWQGADTFGPNGDFWGLALLRVGWSYTAGMLMAQAYQARSWRQILTWHHALTLHLLAIIVLPLLPMPTALGDGLLVIVVLPALFWLLVTATPPVGSSRAFMWLGGLSFPLYAAHLPILVLFAATSLPRPIAATLAVIVALAIAAGYSRIAPAGRGHRSLVTRLAAFPAPAQRGA